MSTSHNQNPTANPWSPSLPTFENIELKTVLTQLSDCPSQPSRFQAFIQHKTVRVTILITSFLFLVSGVVVCAVLFARMVQRDARSVQAGSPDGTPRASATSVVTVLVTETSVVGDRTEETGTEAVTT